MFVIVETFRAHSIFMMSQERHLSDPYIATHTMFLNARGTPTTSYSQCWQIRERQTQLVPIYQIAWCAWITNDFVGIRTLVLVEYEVWCLRWKNGLGWPVRRGSLSQNGFVESWGFSSLGIVGAWGLNSSWRGSTRGRRGRLDGARHGLDEGQTLIEILCVSSFARDGLMALNVGVLQHVYIVRALEFRGSVAQALMVECDLTLNAQVLGNLTCQVSNSIGKISSCSRLSIHSSRTVAVVLGKAHLASLARNLCYVEIDHAFRGRCMRTSDLLPLALKRTWVPTPTRALPWRTVRCKWIWQYCVRRNFGSYIN